jgi:hypothetical protein
MKQLKSYEVKVFCEISGSHGGEYEVQRCVLPPSSPLPPLGPWLLPDHLLASFQLPPRPCKGPNSILSHSHTTPLSLLLLWAAHPSVIGPLPHLSSPIPHWSPQSTWTPISFRARLAHRIDDGRSKHL